jgi:hypothetical protein
MQLTTLVTPVTAGMQDGDIFIPINANTGLAEVPLVYDSSKLSHRLKSVAKPDSPLVLGNFLCYCFEDFPRLIFVNILTKQHLRLEASQFQTIFGNLSYEAIKQWVNDMDVPTVKAVVGWEGEPEWIVSNSAFKIKPKKVHKWTLGKDGVQYASN